MLLVSQACLCLAAVAWAAAAATAGPITLTDKNYAELVEGGSQELWLLEFYAPWCGHCKKLRPILDELAQNPSKKYPMRVGVMDATAEKAVPGRFGIKSYPTIKYYKDGVYGKYEGPRTEDGFRKFSERMHGPTFTLLQDQTREDQLAELFGASSPVVFLLTFPQTAGGVGNVVVPGLFETLAKKQQAQATFAAAVASSGDQKAPSFAKLEKGRRAKVMPLAESLDWASSSSSDISKLEDFVAANNHPLVSALDSHNFKALGSLNRLMVIAVVDYADAGASKKLLQDLDAAAATLPVEQADQFVFGHLDGVQWKAFVKQYEAKVPALLLLDWASGGGGKETFHTTLCDEAAGFGQASITTILTGIKDGSISMKTVPSKGIVDDLQKKFMDYAPYSFLCIIPVVLLVVSCLLQFPDDGLAKKKKE